MSILEVLRIDSTGIVQIKRSESAADGSTSRIWSELSSTALDARHGIHIDARTIAMPWASFLSVARLLHFTEQNEGLEIHYDGETASRLRSWVEDTNSLTENVADYPSETIDAQLASSGWDHTKRQLTDEQQRDLAKILSRPNAANFSVPGSGKTTVALATHQIWSIPIADPVLLVVAPLNAFRAWEETLLDCLSDGLGNFVRLSSGIEAVTRSLASNPRFAIISYGQIPNVTDSLIELLMTRQVHLILDESHKIKAGAQGIQAREVLRIAPFAERRDILSGTPMPQSSADLVPQFEFLYPSSNLRQRIEDSTDLHHTISRLYARTRYSELGIPTPDVSYVSIEMSEHQKLLYSILRDDILRDVARARGSPDLGRPAIMRLLLIAVDIQSAAELLLTIPEYSRGVAGQICATVLEAGLSPRLLKAIQITTELVRSGKKVVVWVPFTSTINRLSRELAQYGARTYYGDTPIGSIEDYGTREQIIGEFHDSPSCNVLIANPAAGGEGISLHRVCHNAIYVGRTYNATHFMQSRDRINRLGMPKGITPQLTIIESSAPNRVGSIDHSVRRRLDLKVQQLADVLDDSDLRAIALESDDADPDLNDGFTLNDLLDLLDEITA